MLDFMQMTNGQQKQLVLLGSANAQPNHLQYGVFSEAMWAGLESVWTGSKSAADAVNDLESELSSKLGDDLIVR